MARDVISFTKPYHDIDIAVSEMGIITQVLVKEGDVVTKGQLLAKLDDTEAIAKLKIAEKAKEARGQIEAAEVELKLQSSVVKKTQELFRNNHAEQFELDRAISRESVLQANLKTLLEDIEIKKLEYERAKIQLRRRQLFSPIDGIVTEIYFDQGEYVSLNQPAILKVVQLDPLLVIFSVPVHLTNRISVGGPVDVQFTGSKQTVKGHVEFISPTVDPQSAETRVRVRIPNPKNKLRCGAECKLILRDKSKPIVNLVIPESSRQYDVRFEK